MIPTQAITKAVILVPNHVTSAQSEGRFVGDYMSSILCAYVLEKTFDINTIQMITYESISTIISKYFPDDISFQFRNSQLQISKSVLNSSIIFQKNNSFLESEDNTEREFYLNSIRKISTDSNTNLAFFIFENGSINSFMNGTIQYSDFMKEIDKKELNNVLFFVDSSYSGSFANYLNVISLFHKSKLSLRQFSAFYHLVNEAQLLGSSFYTKILNHVLKVFDIEYFIKNSRFVFYLFPVVTKLWETGIKTVQELEDALSYKLISKRPIEEDIDLALGNCGVALAPHIHIVFNVLLSNNIRTVNQLHSLFGLLHSLSISELIDASYIPMLQEYLKKVEEKTGKENLLQYVTMLKNEVCQEFPDNVNDEEISMISRIDKNAFNDLSIYIPSKDLKACAICSSGSTQLSFKYPVQKVVNKEISLGSFAGNEYIAGISSLPSKTFKEVFHQVQSYFIDFPVAVLGSSQYQIPLIGTTNPEILNKKVSDIFSLREHCRKSEIKGSMEDEFAEILRKNDMNFKGRSEQRACKQLKVIIPKPVYELDTSKISFHFNNYIFQSPLSPSDLIKEVSMYTFPADLILRSKSIDLSSSPILNDGIEKKPFSLYAVDGLEKEPTSQRLLKNYGNLTVADQLRSEYFIEREIDKIKNEFNEGIHIVNLFYIFMNKLLKSRHLPTFVPDERIEDIFRGEFELIKAMHLHNDTPEFSNFYQIPYADKTMRSFSVFLSGGEKLRVNLYDIFVEAWKQFLPLFKVAPREVSDLYYPVDEI